MSNAEDRPRPEVRDDLIGEDQLVGSIGSTGETTSRRRSPDVSANGGAATTSRSHAEEPSVVLDLGGGELFLSVISHL